MAGKIPPSKPSRPKPVTASEINGRVPAAAGEGYRIPANHFTDLLQKLVFSDEDAELDTLGQAFHTWGIKDWDKLPKKVFGPVFNCGGSPWTVKLFPKGTDQVAAYLKPGYDSSIPKDWYACVRFAIVIWNPDNPSEYASAASHHRFNEEDPDWGFAKLCDFQKLRGKPERGHTTALLHHGKVNITTYVRVLKDPTGYLWHNFHNYDSKAATGMVGLKSQGATDYLNCVLQMLHHISALREIIYQEDTMHVGEDDIILALQRLFYSLQTSLTRVSTSQFTRSLGWSSTLASQDSQESADPLLSSLMERTRTSPYKVAIEKLLSGTRRMESGVISPFINIRLNVRGHRSLESSLKELVGKKKLVNNGKLKIRREVASVSFDALPHVLHLNLNRVEYDPAAGVWKVNDYMEFPEELDMAPYISKSVVERGHFLYSLFGVMVHNGNSSSGHYYVFLRPKPYGRFYKFDDDRVIPASLHEAIKSNFGTDETGTYSTMTATATVLIYIRQSEIHEVLKYLPQSNIPALLRERLTAPEPLELPRALDVSIISEKTFRMHHGFDLAAVDPRPENHFPPNIYRGISGRKPLGEFLKQVAKDYAMDDKLIKLWPLVNRQNKTQRPLEPGHPHQSLGKIKQRSDRYGKQLQLWLDSRAGDANIGTNTILLFLKHFDTDMEILSGFRCIRMRENKEVNELSTIICKGLNWPADTNILYFEEVMPTMIEGLKAHQTLKQLDIGDGDIICFQRQTITAKQHYERLLNNSVLHAETR